MTKTNGYPNIMRAAAVILALVLLTGAGPAQNRVGTTAAQFLGISVGPRAIGMGSAYVASVNDVTSLYWNPGAFQQAGQSQFAFSNANWLVDTKFRWFGFMYNLGDENAFGISLTQLDYGDEEITTVSSPEGTGTKWSAADLSLSVSYCRRLTDRFSMGGSVKYIQQSIWNESANTFAFDLGLLYITGFNDMRLGVTMSNFGGDLKLEGYDLFQRIQVDQSISSSEVIVGSQKTDSWPLPLFFRVGVAMDVYKMNDMRLTVAADALRPNDNEQSLNAGGEVGWNETFFVRAGYKSIFGKDAQEGLSYGAGIQYKAPGAPAMNFDFANTKFGLFGNITTIAVGVGF